MAIIVIGGLTYSWSSLVFDRDTHSVELDNVLDNVYDTMSCLERRQLDAITKDSIIKTQENLAAARSKLSFVDNRLWNNVSNPLNALQTSMDVSDKVANTKSGKVNDNKICSKITTSAELNEFIARSRHLASDLATSTTTWPLPFLLAFATGLVTFLGWLYRTADARLTAIDLVASEMFSLCRAAANNRSAAKLATSYQGDQFYAYSFLSLNEKYSDFMSCMGQHLGFLDQYTISRIAGYYTGLKIMHDRVRGLRNWASWRLGLDLKAEDEHKGLRDPHFQAYLLSEPEINYMRAMIAQIMYDFFLCFENARIALHLLLEKGEFHDTCIFVCLVTDLKAFAFLKTLMHRPNSDGHIQQRLNLRVEDPKKGSYEELESYLHPAYYIAIKKLRDAYETEYQDHVGKDIIETISKGGPPKPPLKDTITSYFKRLVSSRLNLASAGGRAR